MAGKKGPRKLLVATINYVLAGCSSSETSEHAMQKQVITPLEARGIPIGAQLSETPRYAAAAE